MEFCITLSGDVRPSPGPDNVKGRKIPVCTGNQSRKGYKTGRGRVSDNCIRVQLKNSRATKHGNQNKLLKIAHLNAQSLKCRHHLIFWKLKKWHPKMALTFYLSQKHGLIRLFQMLVLKLRVTEFTD